MHVKFKQKKLIKKLECRAEFGFCCCGNIAYVFGGINKGWLMWSIYDDLWKIDGIFYLHAIIMHMHTYKVII